MMKNCDKCGAEVCPSCGKAECLDGRKECLEGKVRRLEQRVKELEAKPLLPQPFPMPYPVPVEPYRRPCVPPYRRPYQWYEVTCGDPVEMTSTSMKLSKFLEANA
jgi:hypothetical protein